jgi:hypothetical protein
MHLLTVFHNEDVLEFLSVTRIYVSEKKLGCQMSRPNMILQCQRYGQTQKVIFQMITPSKEINE